METRNQKYKRPTENVNSLRTRRRKQSEDLRKDRRNKLLSSKRVRSTSTTDLNDITEEKVKELTTKFLKANEDDTADILRFLRKAFAQGSVFIEEFLNVKGSLATLVKWFTADKKEALQLDAAWCLTNASAGVGEEHSVELLNAAGAYLVTYLSSANVNLQDQCLWTVGNLAANGDTCHDLLKSLGVIVPLIKLLKSDNLSIVQSSAYALSNMARGAAVHCSDLMTNGALEILVKLLSEYDNSKVKVISEVCWVLAYLSASGTYQEELVAAGLIDKVIDVIIKVVDKNPNEYQVKGDNEVIGGIGVDDYTKLLTPLLRCLGNLFASSAEITNDKVEELIQSFAILLDSDQHRHIKKESLWVLSNMTAHDDIVDMVLGADLLRFIIELTKAAFDIKKEAVYNLCNIACHREEIPLILLSAGAMQAVTQCLSATHHHDEDIIRLSLNFCHLMLSRKTCKGAVLEVFLDCKGLEGLEALEYHAIEEIRVLSKHILEEFIYPDEVGGAGDS